MQSDANPTTAAQADAPEGTARLEVVVSGLTTQIVALKQRVEDLTAAQPTVIHGKRFEFVNKQTLAARLTLSEDTIDKWVRRGFLPQPFDPERRKGRGRKALLWDFYECVERVRSFQRR